MIIILLIAKFIIIRIILLSESKKKFKLVYISRPVHLLKSGPAEHGLCSGTPFILFPQEIILSPKQGIPQSKDSPYLK